MKRLPELFKGIVSIIKLIIAANKIKFSTLICFINLLFLNKKLINNMINNLEVINLILENDLKKARLQIKKMPFSLKKIKCLIALLLPNNLVKKFIRF